MNAFKYVVKRTWGWWEYYPATSLVVCNTLLKGSTILAGSEAQAIKSLCIAIGKAL